MADNKSVSESFSELSEVVRRYVDARIRFWKLILLEKSTRAGTFLFSSVAVIVAVMSILIFLGFAFSFWYGQMYGSIWVGFLICAGFSLLLLLLILLFRKQIFSRSLIRNLQKLIMLEEEDH